MFSDSDNKENNMKCGESRLVCASTAVETSYDDCLLFYILEHKVATLQYSRTQ